MDDPIINFGFIVKQGNIGYEVHSRLYAGGKVIGNDHWWSRFDYLHEAIADAGRRANEADTPDARSFVIVDVDLSKPHKSIGRDYLSDV